MSLRMKETFLHLLSKYMGSPERKISDMFEQSKRYLFLKVVSAIDAFHVLLPFYPSWSIQNHFLSLIHRLG
jgi:hypothetical protein